MIGVTVSDDNNAPIWYKVFCLERRNDEKCVGVGTAMFSFFIWDGTIHVLFLNFSDIFDFCSRTKPEDQWSCKRSPDILA